ncbi:MAG: hypothetical protein EZS28_036944 [Streblomastix strix]|uniref:Uncharacterized protein n=1 Tax=Streblomastix strix TaxID=222440 RepID=A0A5J4UAM2_9EUKA|nr:MAG: hypothetical protein EZS28_036944 [Streblomastix strix]
MLAVQLFGILQLMAHLFGKSKPQTASKKMEVDREQTIQRFASEKDRLEKRKAFIEQTLPFLNLSVVR